jgi:hypothetical protein
MAFLARNVNPRKSNWKVVPTVRILTVDDLRLFRMQHQLADREPLNDSALLIDEASRGCKGLFSLRDNFRMGSTLHAMRLIRWTKIGSQLAAATEARPITHRRLRSTNSPERLPSNMPAGECALVVSHQGSPSDLNVAALEKQDLVFPGRSPQSSGRPVRHVLETTAYHSLKR